MDDLTTFRTHNSKIWLCSLLSYFMNIKTIDDNIEVLRVHLCSHPNFSPYKLFHFLDKSSKEFILLNDLIKFLKEMDIPFEEKYLRIFIHNFDKDGDFCLNMNEFLGLILPKKNKEFAKKVSSNLNPDRAEDIICSDIKKIFGKLICEELELIKNCIKTAKYCKESVGFTLYEAFLLIAGNSKYICEKNLCNFLQKNNVMLNSNDMHQLMFRLDADNDGKISFEEFKEIFFPIKEEETIYKIKENGSNGIINNDCNYLKNIKEEKEQTKEKVETNKINSVEFTFGKSSHRNSKISIKTKSDYANNLKKLMNYQYDDDLIRNKENKPANTDIINTNREQSLYERTKYLMENKRQSLFNAKMPPKIKLPTQPPTPSHESVKCTPVSKKYQLEYSSNPMFIKKNNNNNPNISSPISPRIVKNQRSNRYQSPKTKHTKSPLHYDYSTYSDEDGDEYFKQKKLKENNNNIEQKVNNINEKKQSKIFGGIEYKNEIKNNFEKMFLEDEKGNNKKVFDINDISKDFKIRKFDFISNESNENDIKMINFDDIRKKNLKMNFKYEK